MRMLFENLRGEFGWRIQDVTLADDPRRATALKLVTELIEKVALFFGGAEKATITVEEGTRDAVEVGLEIGGAPRLMKFLAKFQSERTEKQSVQVMLRNPTPLDLAEVCGIMAETLVGLGWSTTSSSSLTT